MQPAGVARRALAMVVALLALAAVVSACSRTTNEGSGPTTTAAGGASNAVGELEPDVEPQRGGKIIVDTPAEVNGLNPNINQWSDAGTFFGSSLLEPAVLIDREGNWKPYLVDEIKHNDDFTEWDLTLHPGIKFHNDEALDGTVLKKNIESFYQGPLGGVVVGPSYKGVEVTGPLSVRVSLNERWAQYPSSLSTYHIMALEQLNAPDGGVYKAIGTGPFAFDEWKQNQYLRVKKFANYWRKDARGNQLPYLDSIEFRPVPDESEKEANLSKNDVDVALFHSAGAATNLASSFTVIKDYSSERSFIMLNTAQEQVNASDPSQPPVYNPLTNVHARRALAYATDRKAIAKLVGDDVTLTTQGYRPDSKWGLPEDQTGYVAFDIAKAKEEVEAFKKDTGKSTLSVSLLGFTDVDNQKILQALKEQWALAGVETKVDVKDQAQTTILFALGTFQAGFFRWYGWTNPDFNYMFNSSTTAKPIGQLSINFTHYTSPTLDANLRKVRENEDLAVRKAANDEVIRELNEQAVLLWLYDTPYALIANKRVRGLNNFRTNPFGNFAPKPWWGDVWIER